MTEVPTQFVVGQQSSSEPVAEQVLNPELAQARLRVQTIRRFKALHQKIENISDPKEYDVARTKLDALAKREYGKTWEVLKNPGVEVFPMMIGGKTKDELKEALKANGYQISSFAEQMLDNPDFVTLKQPGSVGLIQLTLADLGLFDFVTTDQLHARVKKLGLDLCPAEVGPWCRLKMPNQPIDQYVRIGMQPITTLNGNPGAFSVVHDDAGPWLRSYLAKPNSNWSSGRRFLFCLPVLHSKPTEADHD